MEDTGGRLLPLWAFKALMMMIVGHRTSPSNLLGEGVGHMTNGLTLPPSNVWIFGLNNMHFGGLICSFFSLSDRACLKS